MLGFMQKRLKKLKDIKPLKSDSFYLNILVDLGNYYGITTGNTKLSYADIEAYVLDLRSVLSKFTFRCQSSTIVSLNHLINSANHLGNKRFTFATLCRVYYEKSSKNLDTEEADKFSTYICNKLGDDSRELNKGYIREKLRGRLISLIVTHSMTSLSKTYSVDMLKKYMDRKYMLDSSINLAVDFSAFFRSYSGNIVSVKILISFALRDCCLGNSEKDIADTFKFCYAIADKTYFSTGRADRDAQRRERRVR